MFDVHVPRKTRDEYHMFVYTHTTNHCQSSSSFKALGLIQFQLQWANGKLIYMYNQVILKWYGDDMWKINMA